MKAGAQQHGSVNGGVMILHMVEFISLSLPKKFRHESGQEAAGIHYIPEQNWNGKPNAVADILGVIHGSDFILSDLDGYT